LRKNLGRVALQDVVNPLTNEVLVQSGQQITEAYESN
jgi:DNA-directed RNA polymerase subunit beta'